MKFGLLIKKVKYASILHSLNFTNYLFNFKLILNTLLSGKEGMVAFKAELTSSRREMRPC